ncbi:MAG: SwmB domain-containing protein [Spirochaetaceae bacterium]|nr:SwmB domain-containing protein [Spirochaetaceae bacterium]
MLRNTVAYSTLVALAWVALASCGGGPGAAHPDLVVEAPEVSDHRPAAGASFTFSTTVRNAGRGNAAATTLRVYRSKDATITTDDKQVGLPATVAELAASERMVTAVMVPSIPGTSYYYGACVEPVARESDTANNCSAAKQVIVPEVQDPEPASPRPNLVVESPSVSPDDPAAAARFTFRATVRNAGRGSAAATTLRVYRSDDATITPDDKQEAAAAVPELAASERSPASEDLSAPASAGTYYYGACVDAVAGESDPNNCSEAVQVTVQAPQVPVSDPAHRVNSKPHVTGVEVSSDVGDDAAYALGETIRVRLAFSGAVAVTGTPRVKLGLGSGPGEERWAAYASGSGTAMLEFAWTVAEGDASDVGVAVLANTLALNGGAIKSTTAAGENATLAHAGLGHDPAHRVDARPPKLSAASTNGATLILIFDEALGASASLANGAFTVKKTPQGGTEQDVSLSGSPAISGATVTLTLAAPVLETDTDVKVSYGKPTSGAGNRLQDAVGNEVASFTDKPVTNGSRSPGVERAHVDGTALTITFDEALGAAASLGNGPFMVKKTPQGGTEQNVSLSGTPAIGGATVTLTLADAVLETDKDVKVSYTRPTSGTGNRLRDEAGNEVASFSDQAVSTDNTPPRLVRGEIDGGTVTLYFSESLDPDSVGGHFRVTVRHEDGLKYNANAEGDVEISGNAVAVGLGSPFGDWQLRAKAGEQRNHAYYIKRVAPTAKSLRDPAGNPVSTPHSWGDGWLRTQIIVLDNITAMALSVADALYDEKR